MFCGETPPTTSSFAVLGRTARIARTTLGANALLVDERRDARLARRDERLNETVARLAVRDGDVRNALVRAELRAELIRRDADVRCGRG